MPAPALPPLRPFFEARERVERRTDRDFDRSIPDGRTEYLTRLRLGADYRGKGWHAQAAFQESHVLTLSDARNFSDDRPELVRGWVALPLGAGEVTVGRQVIAYGGERLLGEAPWPQGTNSWDGFRYRSREFDVFGATTGTSVRPNLRAIIAGGAYRSRAGETLFVQKRDDPAPGRVEVSTLSQHWVRKTRAWTFDVEAAGQLGSVAPGRRLEAWAFAARATHRLSSRWSLFAEGDAASGGGDANVSRTFDNLYPSNHPYYGLMDLEAWRNVLALTVGLQASANRHVSGQLLYTRLALRDPADAWYGLFGPNPRPGGIYVDPTGSRGRDVGDEVDLEGRWRPHPNRTYSLGVAVFRPGGFVRSFGTRNEQFWLYAQAEFRF